MKRDDDLIRDILLQLEAKPPGREINALTLNEGPAEQILVEHIRLLREAGFIQARFTQYVEHETQPLDLISIERITWQGHEFIASVRSDSIWSKTKDRVAAVGGSVSIATLSQIAGAVAKELLRLP